MVNNLKWLGKDQRTFLSRGYLDDNQTPEERYQEICDTIQRYAHKQSFVLGETIDEDGTIDNYPKIKNIGKRFERYVQDGWVSFATPVLKNFGKLKNLPISCNQSILDDSLDDIHKGLHEIGMLASNGAGTSQNFSKIRPIGSSISSGGKSNSILDWVELYADLISKTAQNSARRGFLTAYLSLDHAEIMDFLDIGTKAIPEDKQRFFQTITTGVTIPIGWRKSLKEGDVEKRKIWAKVLKTRKEIGFPYILDLENCNDQKPQAYKDKGLMIETSNICNEIVEYCDVEKTFACCLSSINAYLFDEWKDDPDFIFDMNIMLDCVIEEYIQKASKINGLQKAVKFAKEHRAVGLGVLGFHSYLQKNMISFGSLESYQVNHKIFSKLKKESDLASQWMAKNWGEPEIMKGYGLRNSTRLAQAPTKSTSFIMNNVSEGIDTITSNYNETKKAKIQVEFKNKELVYLLNALGKNTREVWNSIEDQNGSVQHLSFLSHNEKDVFKTSSEISQVDVIKLAAQRQKFIDQGQSLNIMIHPETSAKDINKLHMLAFDEGIKGLYYQHSINAAQEFSRDLLECSSCEG
jgi:ribonucleoside-diphosphate reductase alpha chain